MVDPTKELPALIFWMKSGRKGLRMDPEIWSAAMTASSDRSDFDRARGLKSGRRLRRMDFLFFGAVKLSSAKAETMKPAARSRAEVTKKLTRRPNRSAITPPNSGPRDAPRKIAIWSRPRAYPTSSRGAIEATMIVAAAIVPVMQPCMVFSTTSCQGALTRPMRSITTVPPNMARRSMGLRP